jgi:hypothetical protein
MTRFPWRVKLAELAEDCAPDGWELQDSSYRRGIVEIWRYQRHDKTTDTSLYVEISAIIIPMSDDASIQILVGSREPNKSVGRCTLLHAANPEFFPELTKHLQDAYAEVKKLQAEYNNK